MCHSTKPVPFHYEQGENSDATTGSILKGHNYFLDLHIHLGYMLPVSAVQRRRTNAFLVVWTFTRLAETAGVYYRRRLD